MRGRSPPPPLPGLGVSAPLVQLGREKEDGGRGGGLAGLSGRGGTTCHSPVGQPSCDGAASSLAARLPDPRAQAATRTTVMERRR